MTGVTVKVPPLQIVRNWEGITGLGFRFTVTKNGNPVQVPTFGVTLYVAMTGALVVLAKVPKILFCVNFPTPPVKPEPLGGGQLYVVPVGAIVVGGAFTGDITNGSSLHLIVLCGGITGVGFIVTVTVKLDPMQPPAAPEVGITV